MKISNFFLLSCTILIGACNNSPSTSKSTKKPEPTHDSSKTPVTLEMQDTLDSLPTPPTPTKARKQQFAIPIIIDDGIEDPPPSYYNITEGAPMHQEAHDGIMQDDESTIDFGPDEDMVYEVVDQMPEFLPKDQLTKFIADNLVRPTGIQEAEIEGSMKVGFIVEKDGRLTNISILQSTNSEEMDSEIIRIIKKMPRFSPAKINGKPVRCRMTMPITFSLED